MGIHIGRLGEVRVLVRPEDYDAAQALLLPPDEPDSLPDDVDRIIFDDDDPEDE